MKFKVIYFILIVLAVSCQKKSSKVTSINGTWESLGSGWILQIQDSTQYSLFDITTISCLPKRQAPLNEILKNLSLKSDTLSLTKGVISYKFTKTDTLPSLCNQIITEQKKKDVLYNFEVFSKTLEDHYIFDDLNDINLQEIYQEQKQKLKSNPTDLNLYKTLEETLEIINDNHAFLEASTEVQALVDELDKNEVQNPSNKQLQEYGDFQIAHMVAENHMVENMTKDSWLINWGEMENNIGFIQVKSMWLYADLDLSESLVKELGYVDAYIKTFHEINEGTYIESEVAGVNKIMNMVMNDLKNTTSIIIDLRFNGGGQDAVSFEILKRFNEKTRQIASSKLKYKDGFSPNAPIYLSASDKAYTNPVFVITSQQTGSASEAFSIGTMSLPHIKRIGMPTQGALSTALEKKLPNGWTFSISNEIYSDNNGSFYENIGVPVDYQIAYPEDRQTFFRSVADNLDADKKQILNAIEQLKNK